MTEELRQKAERFRNKYKQDIIDNDDFEMLDNFDVNVERAYIAGATENGIQWHDLRKDPNDLPEEYCSVLDDEGRQVELRKGYWRFVYGGEWEDDAIVYAWCEIPTFDKE